MALDMTIAWLPLFIIFSISVQDSFEKKNEASGLTKFFLEHKVFDPIYTEGRKKSDPKGLPFRRVTQLYSRNSREHIRILPSRKIDAMGKDGDKYAKLVIESDNFGRVRIRGAATNFYMCIDKRRRLRARVRGRKKDNCIFQEHFADNAFTEFTSVNQDNLYIAFNRRGRQRACNKTRSGMKAVQFIERPLRILRLYRGRKNKKNRRNEKIEKGITHQRHTVCITVKSWRQWRKYLKWRREQKKARRNLKSKLLRKRNNPRKTTTIPSVIPWNPDTRPATQISVSSSPTNQINTRQ